MATPKQLGFKYFELKGEPCIAKYAILIPGIKLDNDSIKTTKLLREFVEEGRIFRFCSR
ncbi:MAG: hypothetical protein ACOX3T_07325 [Bdellovibrionota bacterium]